MVFTKSLKERYSFRYMLKKSKYISKKYITVYYLKDKNNKQENFLGICVSKKHGNSVVRNRLKRWVREAYKECEKNINKGYKIIVLYKKNINVDNINFHVLKNEFCDSLKETELYINE